MPAYRVGGLSKFKVGGLWKFKKDDVDESVTDGGAEERTTESRSRMSNDRYGASFTTGGLFRRESVKLAGLYLELGDWISVRDRVVAENLLQFRTLGTSKRICREVVSRLKTLSPDELEFLVETNHPEQAYLLWIAVCRRHKFIADFAVEVLRERYITLKPDLTCEDFDSFLNRKSEWHSNLDEIRPATRNKLRQVLFKMLREADLLTAGNTINPAMPGPNLIDLIVRGNRRDLSFFPAFESDLKEMEK